MYYQLFDFSMAQNRVVKGCDENEISKGKVVNFFIFKNIY